MTATLAASSHTISAVPGPSRSTVSLLARARDLRARAQRVHPVVAQAYLRRAAELRLEAWAQAARSAPIETDDFTAAA